jgi:hypothetical protein
LRGLSAKKARIKERRLPRGFAEAVAPAPEPDQTTEPAPAPEPKKE